MLTDENYNELNQYVYRTDPKHKDFNRNLKENKMIDGGDIEYKILIVEDNTTNSMQAMAVAPIVNDKADTSEIVIVYAGTNL